jgi:hypothetical protein
MSFSERGAGQDLQFHGTLLLIQELSKISAAAAPESSMVGPSEVGILTPTQAVQIGPASTWNDPVEHECSGRLRWRFSSDHGAVIRL